VEGRNEGRARNPGGGTAAGGSGVRGAQGVEGGLLRRTVAAVRADDLTDRAAALTYYAVLAIFPALIALISLLGLVSDPKETTDTLTEFVTKVGPSSAASTFKGSIDALASNRAAVGAGLVVGLALALWTASAYVGAFSRASDVIYGEDEERPAWRVRPLQMLVTLVLVLLVAVVAAALVITGPLAADLGAALGIGDAAVTAWEIAKWPVVLLIVVGVIAALYASTPSAKPSGVGAVLPGALLAVAAWLLASAGFAAYAAHFSRYDRTYGALGGVVVFLVWLWITNLAILLGAELNAARARGRAAA